MPCWEIDSAMNRCLTSNERRAMTQAEPGRTTVRRWCRWPKLEVALLILALAGLPLKLEAQEGPATVAPPAVRRPNAVRPPQPVESTPVDYFRQLLAAKGEERERLLASRPAGQHAQFRAILQEYERCTPEERERRLQALELRYRITAMLRLAPEARTQAVARLSEAVRPLVQERLN